MGDSGILKNDENFRILEVIQFGFRLNFFQKDSARNQKENDD
jgi:hypothetical protein